MHLDKTEEWISWLFGLIGGSLAYANIPVILHIDWSFIFTKLLGLGWAGIVACFSGAMGWFGQYAVQKLPWIKKIFKSKNPLP